MAEASKLGLPPVGGDGSRGGTDSLVTPPSPGRRNVGRRRGSSIAMQPMLASPKSPGRDSAVSRLTERRGAEALPMSFTGSVDVIKYRLMHFEPSLSLMVIYQLFFAIPSTMLHKASITMRAANTALLSARKQRRLTTRRVLTRYKVYNFRPLGSAGPGTQSDEAAISTFAADARVAGRRGRLSPDAAAALVTYTRIHPWTVRRHAPRHGSVSGTSHGSPDLAPFVSDHTAARLGLSGAEADLARSPVHGSASAGALGPDALALPPSSMRSKAQSGGAAKAPRGRAAQTRRSRSVVDFTDHQPEAARPPRAADARHGPASVSASRKAQGLPAAVYAAEGASPGPDSPLPPSTIGGASPGFGAVKPFASKAAPAVAPSPLAGTGAQRGSHAERAAGAGGVGGTGAS